jgi:hypothetical protein
MLKHKSAVSMRFFSNKCLEKRMDTALYGKKFKTQRNEGRQDNGVDFFAFL